MHSVLALLILSSLASYLCLTVFCIVACNMTSIKSFAVLQVIFLVAVGMLAGTCAGHNPSLRPGRRLKGLPVDNINNPVGKFDVMNSVPSRMTITVSVITNVDGLVKSDNSMVIPFEETRTFDTRLVDVASTATSLFEILVGKDKYANNPSATSSVFADVGGVAGKLVVTVKGPCSTPEVSQGITLSVTQKLAGLVDNPAATKEVCYPKVQAS